MSDRENLAIVERTVEVWNANDWGGIEAVFAPGAELTPPADWPEAADVAGWAGIESQFRRLKEPWQKEQIEIVDSRVAGSLVYVEFKWITTGEASGVPVESQFFAVYEICDGLIARVDYCRNSAEALARLE